MEIDIEEVIRIEVAKKIIDTMPVSERQKILEASLSKTLKDVLSSWSVEKAIRVDVNKYMSEYLQRTEVQSRIKKATEESVDLLMDGVIRVIIKNSQEGIRSHYAEFIK